ncbi:leucine-rich repeat protein [Skeletonema marinoi]|uniref:Leucine-rich repeat protein n=1 Tax=Skeletonema marinoi TaxID=267567 RepID=A0AAD8XYQ8_9STRA|nr:leucine-rich repeat protein [Skeletonema marinoi]
MNYQYDTLASSVRLKDVISCAENRAILYRLKNNDPCLTDLFIDVSDDDYGDGVDIFQVGEGDDLGWLGYFIGRNETLESLYVYYLPGDAEQGKKFFFGIQRNTSINVADVSVRGFPGESFSSMNLPHVTWMSVDCHQECAHSFAIGLRRCESLKTYYGPVTAEIVSSLVSLPMLEDVNVETNGGLAMAISREECMALRELLANATGIMCLNLGRVGLGNDGSELMAEGLACNSSLTIGELYLRDNDIGDRGLQALASSLASNGKVQELNLSNNNIGDKGVEALAESLAHNRALRVLSISENAAITEIGVRAISRSLQSRKCLLEDLRLDRINIGEEGGKILGDALSINTSLVTLSLSCGENGVSIGDDGLNALALGLSHNSHLKYLDLSGNRAITSVGLRSLKQYFQSPSCALEKLIIYSIDFGDEGAYALADDALGQNKSLKVLIFDERGITTKGWDAFLKLLCDSSSPNSIYLSNHTLRDLGGFGDESEIRTSVLDWLKMNEDCETSNVAAKAKIMHFFADLDMVPLFQWKLKFLPLVKSWFDTVASPNDIAANIRNRELSAVYQFVRGLPLLVANDFQHYLTRQVERIRAQISELEEEERRLMQV